MTERDQIYQFGNELDKLIERTRKEYEITYAAVVGVLFMKAQMLAQEPEDADDEP